MLLSSYDAYAVQYYNNIFERPLASITSFKNRKMKKRILITFALITTFGLGFAFKSVITHSDTEQPIKKATGIGGIFFKCKDPKKIREWYQAHLGLNTNQYGAVFEWRQGADTTKKGFTQWSPF